MNMQTKHTPQSGINKSSCKQSKSISFQIDNFASLAESYPVNIYVYTYTCLQQVISNDMKRRCNYFDTPKLKCVAWVVHLCIFGRRYPAPTVYPHLNDYIFRLAEHPEIARPYEIDKCMTAIAKGIFIIII